MITVMGATGHTGNQIVEILLGKGHAVRAVGRSEAKLERLKQAGAELAVGDVRDRAFLTRAFTGASAAYVLLAADPTAAEFRAEQDRMSEAIVESLRAAQVAHIVALSSLGADLSTGNGPIAGIHVHEARLKTLHGAHVLALRPAWFMENLEIWIPLVQHQGIAGDSLDPEHAQPMVATRDIARVAAEALIARSTRGFTVRELLGPRDISATEATRVLGAALGKPELPYIRFSDEDTQGALILAGLSAEFASLYTEMTRAVNAGKLKPQHGRTQENTTPTELAEYVQDLVGAVRV